MVVDSQRGMALSSVAYFSYGKKKIVTMLHRLARLGVQYEKSLKAGSMIHHNSELSLMVVVNSKKHLNPIMMKLKEPIHSMFNSGIGYLGINSV